MRLLLALGVLALAAACSALSESPHAPFAPGCVLTGTAVDRHGQPLPGVLACARAYTLDARPRAEPAQGVSAARLLVECSARAPADSAGRFAIELPAAAFGGASARVRICARGEDELGARELVIPSPAPRELPLGPVRLRREDRRICAGRLRSATGAPLDARAARFELLTPRGSVPIELEPLAGPALPVQPRRAVLRASGDGRFELCAAFDPWSSDGAEVEAEREPRCGLRVSYAGGSERFTWFGENQRLALDIPLAPRGALEGSLVKLRDIDWQRLCLRASWFEPDGQRAQRELRLAPEDAEGRAPSASQGRFAAESARFELTGIPAGPCELELSTRDPERVLQRVPAIELAAFARTAIAPIELPADVLLRHVEIRTATAARAAMWVCVEGSPDAPAAWSGSWLLIGRESDAALLVWAPGQRFARVPIPMRATRAQLEPGPLLELEFPGVVHADWINPDYALVLVPLEWPAPGSERFAAQMRLLPVVKGARLEFRVPWPGRYALLVEAAPGLTREQLPIRYEILVPESGARWTRP